MSRSVTIVDLLIAADGIRENGVFCPYCDKPMAFLIRFLLFATVPVTGSRTVKLGILLETDRNCQDCRNNKLIKHSEANLNISLFKTPYGDIFAKIKAIRKFEGDVVLTTKCASFPGKFLDHWTTNTDKCCSMCLMNPLHLTNILRFEPKPSIDNSLISNEQSKDSKFLDLLSFILKNEKFTTYIAITDSVEDSTIVFHLHKEGTMALSYIVDHTGQFQEEDQLREIFETIDEEHLNFVVICSTNCLKHIMNHLQAIEEDVEQSAYFKRSRWLLVTTNALGHKKDEFLTGFPRIDSATIIIVNFRYCQYTHGFLTQLARGPPAVAEVYSMFATNSGQQLRMKGHVTNDKNMILKEQMFEKDKYGYNNRTFVVGILTWEPFVFKSEVNGRVEYSGISVYLLNELARRLNFSYIFKEPDDQEWGRVINGKWTGLVGEVSERKIDMIGCPLTISYERETVMDFTPGYFFDHAMILFEKQNPDANKWLTLVAPFRYEVLICIVVSLILCTIFLFLLEEVNPGNLWAEKRLSARRKRYGDILWYHFGALMANGGAYLPKTVSGRSVLACWWIFTVMMAAIYSGNLIAFLAVNRPTQPFTSISEMIVSDYKWGLLGGSAMITLFKNSNVNDYKQIWKVIERESAIDPDIQSLDNEVHLKKVLSEKYAFIGEITTWDVWQRKSCDLDLLGERFYPMTYGMGFPNNSIHTKVFSNQLQSIQESGLVEVWYQRWLPVVRCELPNKDAKRADILALQSIFYAAGAGVLLALIILTAELVYNRRCKRTLDLKLPYLNKNSE